MYPKPVSRDCSRLASLWHGGQDCPLYSIASTGTIYSRSIGYDALSLIRRLINSYPADVAAKKLTQLRLLRSAIHNVMKS